MSDRQRSDNREGKRRAAVTSLPSPGRRSEGSQVTAAEVDVQLRSFTRKQRGFRVTGYLTQRIKGK